MGAVMLISPSGQKNFFCDTAGAASLREAYRVHRGVTDLREEPLPVLTFDFGGAMCVGEEDVRFEAAGIAFRVPITQFEDLLGVLREVSVRPDGCVRFGGWMGFFYCLSAATRDAVVAEMGRLAAGVAPRAAAARETFYRALEGPTSSSSPSS